MKISATSGHPLPAHDPQDSASAQPSATPVVARGPTPGKGIRIPKATLAAARAVDRHHAQRLANRRQMIAESTSVR